METITIKEEKLLQLIQLYNNALYDLGKSTKCFNEVKEELKKNIEPFAPSISEYNAYVNKKKINDLDLELYRKKVIEAETMTLNAKKEILQNLPGNKWLKIGAYYVGKRTNDWPGADNELLISTKKPTTEIHHQIIN